MAVRADKMQRACMKRNIRKRGPDVLMSGNYVGPRLALTASVTVPAGRQHGTVGFRSLLMPFKFTIFYIATALDSLTNRAFRG
jgi:hypothetical protein